MKLQPTAHETLQLSVNSQQVTKGLFTAILFECTLRVGQHRVLAARKADPSRTLLRLRCNLLYSASFR